MRWRLMTSLKVFVSATVQYGSEPENLWSIVGTASDMGTTQNIFSSQLVSESFDSTQLMTHNGFTGIDSNQLTTQNGFLKIDSNRFTTEKFQGHFYSNQLMTKKKLSRILIQINSWLKKPGILIWIESWLNDSNQLLISLTFSWAFTQFRWPFLGFHSISFIFLGFSINFVDLFGTFN